MYEPLGRDIRDLAWMNRLRNQLPVRGWTSLTWSFRTFPRREMLLNDQVVSFQPLSVCSWRKEPKHDQCDSMTDPMVFGHLKMSPDYLLLVGSTSALKRDACLGAVQLAGMRATVLLLDVKSYVPEQPYGEIETSAGAVNRSLGALHAYHNMLRSGERKEAPSGTIVLAIGIENGLLPELVHSGKRLVESVTLDRGCVVICSPFLKGLIKVYSEGVVVPSNLVVEAIEVHNQEVTAGTLEAARTPGCDHLDPHKIWSKGKTSRSDLLIPALLKALQQAQAEIPYIAFLPD